MKYISKKITEWVKEDLRRTEQSLFYILTGVKTEGLDERVKREVAETNPIANYNYYHYYLPQLKAKALENYTLLPASQSSKKSY